MKVDIIENNVIVNTIMASLDDAQLAYPNLLCVAATGGSIGDSVINGVLISQAIEKPKITVISMRQARLQLLAMNLLYAVNAQISTMPQSAQIEWDWASEVRRDNPLVAQLQSSLAMTDNDMNQFFYDASLL